jgi:protein subunit release factor A
MSKNLILSKLEGVKERFEEVGRLLNEPGVMNDMKNYIHLNKEYKELDPVVAAYKEYKNTLINIDSTKELLAVEKDDEMREMAKAELDDLTGKVVDMEENLKILLLPTDPQDEKNAILEIREMKPVFLPATCSAFIPNTVSRKAGKWKLPILPRVQRVVIRKSLWMSGETGFMVF